MIGSTPDCTDSRVWGNDSRRAFSDAKEEGARNALHFGGVGFYGRADQKLAPPRGAAPALVQDGGVYRPQRAVNRPLKSWDTPHPPLLGLPFITARGAVIGAAITPRGPSAPPYPAV